MTSWTRKKNEQHKEVRTALKQRVVPLLKKEKLQQAEQEEFEEELKTMLTLDEIKEILASTYDECSLLDLLGVNSFQIVEAFEQEIIDNFEKLHAVALDEENSEEESNIDDTV